MTSYTSSLRLAQMVTADPAVRDQWGTIWDGTVAVVEQAITGNSPINIAGLTSYTLTVANNAPDQARQFVYPFTGALTARCAIGLPGVPKFGLVSNNTTGGQPLLVGAPAAWGSGGRTLTVPPGQSSWFSCDGTNVDAPVLAGATPIGGLMQFAGSVAPARWLMCFGQAISRTTYALLFGVIGTTYGAGDGSTTFNVPDLRGRTMFGLDNMGGTAAGRVTSASGTPGTTLGGVGGSELLQSHGHGVSDPSHTHGVNDPAHAHSVSDPGHAHSISDPSHIHGVGDPGHSHSGWTDAQGNHNHSVNAFGASGGPNAIAPGVIATGQTIYTSTDGNHSHNVGTNAAGTGLYLGYAATGISIQGHVTGIGIYGAYTGVSNQYAGTGISIYGAGGGATQNMPPAMMLNTLIYAGA
jgi:microcystin-dependent protein